MAKFLTYGAKKLMENFIESSGRKGAIYDEEMNLIWTNYHNFFDGFDIKKLNMESPLISDKSFSAETDGMRAVLNITPVYKSPRVISVYVCIIREAYDIYKMMSKTIISDFSDNIMKKNMDRLERLVKLNNAIGEIELEESDAPGNTNGLDELNDLVKQQERLLVSMKNETKFYIDSCFNEVEDMSCNVSLLFSTVCECAAESFREIDRKVSFTADENDYYSALDGRALLVGFLHLLRSHVIMSPPKTVVAVNASFEALTKKNGLYIVNVKTALLPSEDTDKARLTTSRAYRELAKKVVMYDYGGSFECLDSKKNMQTVLKIPTRKNNRGLGEFNANKKKYGNSENGTITNYLRDIIYCENSGGTDK